MDGGERVKHYVAPVPKFHIWQEKTSRPMDKPNDWKKEKDKEKKINHTSSISNALQAHVHGRRAAAAATKSTVSAVVAVTESRPPLSVRENKRPHRVGVSRCGNDANRRKPRKRGVVIICGRWTVGRTKTARGWIDREENETKEETAHGRMTASFRFPRLCTHGHGERVLG